MNQPNQLQIQIEDLKRQITDLRLELRAESNRLNGIWWKMGLLAGIVSIIASEVFGGGIGSVVNLILGW